MPINVNSNNGDSNKCYNKFWKQSISEDTTTEEDSSSGNSNYGNTAIPTERRNDNYNYEISSKTTTTTTSATSYEYTIRNSSDNSIQTSTNSRNSHQQVRVFNAFEETSTSTSTKRYQTKMLLASLIEHFCQAYGDTPDSNRKVFFLICRTLRSLGIVDAEFVDEMTSVRSAFQHAFQKLFYTAVQTVRNQDLIHFDDNLPRMLIKSAPASPQESDEDSSCLDSSDETSSSCPAADKAFPSVSSSERQMEDYFSARTSQVTASSFSNKLSSSATTANPALHCMVNGGGGDFFHNLSVQNSRYKNDFVEKNLLGKGGFASAFCACNRLDGIDYAIKKIRLGNDIEEIDRSNKENPYEKIFREIKNLARLEHHNVIRYYSSWLEFDDSTGDQDGSDESDLEDSYSRRSYQHRKKFTIASDEEDNDTSSIFQGRDPTFSDPSMSSLGGGRYMCNDESGMSQIQFGECSNSGYEAGSAGGAATSNGSWSTSVRSRSASYSNKKAKSGWTLFIQMQLCPTTLHDYIRSRNKRYSEESSCDIIDTQRNIEIFSQILEGTAYIHDQGLIHRDLKPSNIFLSMPSSTSTYVHDSDGKRIRTSTNSRRRLSSFDSSSPGSTGSSPYATGHDYMWEESWVPKIGDFGLAAEVIDEGTGDAVLVPTPISSTPPSPKISPSFGNNANSPTAGQVISNNRPTRPKPQRTRTLGVGTRTYASPEQLAIPAQAYDEKVDIYSLGIILFELFQPFATGMERADSIEKLKRGVFPEGFLEAYPKVTALIIWMMDENPNHRPKAHQLLEFELFSHPSSRDDQDVCSTLQTKLQSKISQLERKNIEIEELKQTVARVELEKQQALEEMQAKLEEMQLKLDSLSHTQGSAVETTSNGTAVKKCILSPTPSFLKKKKEVRWSTLNSISNT